MKLKLKVRVMFFVFFMAIGAGIFISDKNYWAAFWVFSTTFWYVLYDLQCQLTDFWKVIMKVEIENGLAEVKELVKKSVELESLAEELKKEMHATK